MREFRGGQTVGGWRSSAKRLFLNGGYPIGLALFGVLLAYWVPASWDVSAGPLSPLAGAMSAFIPSMRSFIAVSSFPGVTATVLAILWVSLPLLVWAHLWTLDVLHGSRRRHPAQRASVGDKKFSFAYKCV